MWQETGDTHTISETNIHATHIAAEVRVDPGPLELRGISSATYTIVLHFNRWIFNRQIDVDEI